jgi:hypothetical protein
MVHDILDEFPTYRIKCFRKIYLKNGNWKLNPFGSMQDALRVDVAFRDLPIFLESCLCIVKQFW